MDIAWLRSVNEAQWWRYSVDGEVRSFVRESPLAPFCGSQLARVRRMSGRVPIAMP